MADITEIAVAAWRLEKWLDNVHVERKMAAKSSLRAIKKYLAENNIEVVDLTGSMFDVGLAVNVVNNESNEKDEEKLLISEMVKPIIKENGAIIQYGQVILGDEVKKPKTNNSVPSQPESKVAAAEKLVTETVKSVTAGKEESGFEKIPEQSVTVKDNKSRIGVCIILLHAVLIVGVIALAILLSNVSSRTNQLLELNQKNAQTIPDTTEPADLSGVEDGIENIGNRLDNIENEINALHEKADENNSSTEQETVAEEPYIIYVVQKGDTLLKICSLYDIDFYANRAIIMRMNYMENADEIEVGQKLLLPKL